MTLQPDHITMIFQTLAAGSIFALAIWLSRIIYYRRLEKRDPGYADRVRRSELMKASKGEY